MAHKYCHRSQQYDKMTDKMTDCVTKKKVADRLVYNLSFFELISKKIISPRSKYA